MRKQRIMARGREPYSGDFWLKKIKNDHGKYKERGLKKVGAALPWGEKRVVNFADEKTIREIYRVATAKALDAIGLDQREKGDKGIRKKIYELMQDTVGVMYGVKSISDLQKVFDVKAEIDKILGGYHGKGKMPQDFWRTFFMNFRRGAAALRKLQVGRIAQGKPIKPFNQFPT